MAAVPDMKPTATVPGGSDATAAAAVPKGWTFGNNSATALLAIASDTLDGELAAKAGRFDEAIAKLRAAARTEDGLTYDEPPGWMQPVRHTLGAVLLRAAWVQVGEGGQMLDMAELLG